MEEEFIKYTNNYLDLGYKVELKVNHTFRVKKLCKKLASSLNFNDDDILLAEVCGLLHDIGRFEQIKMFDSFSDRNIDHGDLGIEILKNDNFIHKFNSNRDDDNLILNTVKYHNKFMIDENLSDREKTFCNIVRDADKIDILFIEINDMLEISEIDDSFSPKVMESLINHELVLKSDIKTKADHLAINLGYIFDINFKYSINYLKENDYFNKLIDRYLSISLNDGFKDQLEKIRLVINKYMEDLIC